MCLEELNLSPREIEITHNSVFEFWRKGKEQFVFKISFLSAATKGNVEVYPDAAKLKKQ